MRMTSGNAPRTFPPKRLPLKLLNVGADGGADRNESEREGRDRIANVVNVASGFMVELACIPCTYGTLETGIKYK